MARGSLTAEEIRILIQNPYVSEVNENRIIYTAEFKQLFMREYLSGKGPTTIFREAGFDTAILGSKRIERAAARWREAYPSGVMHDYGEKSAPIHKKKNDLKQKQLNELKAEVELLKKQIELLGTCISLKNVL